MSNINTMIEWKEWFNSCDLQHLEDVREYVEAHALDNGADCGGDIFNVAKETVLSYINDAESAEVFEYYRKNGGEKTIKKYTTLYYAFLCFNG